MVSEMFFLWRGKETRMDTSLPRIFVLVLGGGLLIGFITGVLLILAAGTQYIPDSILDFSQIMGYIACVYHGIVLIALLYVVKSGAGGGSNNTSMKSMYN